MPHHRRSWPIRTSVEAEVLLELAQEVEDLRLDRDVQRRDRLVGDHQLGLQRERPCDADALSLAAGELVRVAVVMLGVESDLLHEAWTALPSLPSSRPWMRNGAPMIARPPFAS